MVGNTIIINGVAHIASEGTNDPLCDLQDDSKRAAEVRKCGLCIRLSTALERDRTLREDAWRKRTRYEERT